MRFLALPVVGACSTRIVAFAEYDFLLVFYSDLRSTLGGTVVDLRAAEVYRTVIPKNEQKNKKKVAGNFRAAFAMGLG